MSEYKIEEVFSELGLQLAEKRKNCCITGRNKLCLDVVCQPEILHEAS